SQNPSSAPKPCPEDARCNSGSTSPKFCGSLLHWNEDKTNCVPETQFYLLIGGLILFGVLVIVIVTWFVYWNLCSRRRRISEDKVPLVSNRSRKSGKEPVYTGL
ncbi:hypothetical protein GBAR_LOCUS18973, partial [Geodia barretti]